MILRVLLGSKANLPQSMRLDSEQMYQLPATILPLHKRRKSIQQLADPAYLSVSFVLRPTLNLLPVMFPQNYYICTNNFPTVM
jgi:hypothetical protein